MDWIQLCERCLLTAIGIGVFTLIYVVVEVVRIDDVRIEL
jgi:hypothetical protein